MKEADTTPRFAADSPRLAENVTEAVNREGFAIVTGLLEEDTCNALVKEVERIECDHDIDFGKNDFEGFHTRRIFNLIQRGTRFREVVVEERMLAIVEAILGVDFLLSGTTSMHLGPGETPQLLHADDGMITLPRPHIATLLTTLWALTDFRDENGATRLVPRSHLDPEMPRPGEAHETIAADMPAGSVLFLHGSTWHGGGRNTTPDQQRYGLSVQFVAGWCRQQQNLLLGTNPDVVSEYPQRLQELIGYSLYKNVMGHVNRQHPRTLLGLDVEPNMIWEKMGTEDEE